MILLVGGEKGGTGKTTIATNIAAALASAGRDVLLIDTDPQGSGSFWCAMRSENSKLARVGSIQKFGKGLQSEVRNLASRYEDVIIDAGGRDSIELRAALCVANTAILPIQASQFDLWTIKQLSDLVETARGFNPELRAVCVISRGSTNIGNTDAKEASDLISEYPSLTLSNTIIRDRLAYKRAAGVGKSVIEYGSDQKAVEELNNFKNEVCK